MEENGQSCINLLLPLQSFFLAHMLISRQYREIFDRHIKYRITSYPYTRFMSREKIKVPGKVYEELVALQREIHFTQDHNDTVKKAEDRGYMAAANWIRQNERAYKIGFAWGFESDGEEPQGMIRDIPERSTRSGAPSPGTRQQYSRDPQKNRRAVPAASFPGSRTGLENISNPFFRDCAAGLAYRELSSSFVKINSKGTEFPEVRSSP